MELGTHYSGVCVHDNYFHGNSGVTANSIFGMESTGTSNFMFSNVISLQGYSDCATGGIAVWTGTGTSSSGQTIVNNTFLPQLTAASGCTSIKYEQTSSGVMENNWTLPGAGGGGFVSTDNIAGDISTADYNFWSLQPTWTANTAYSLTSSFGNSTILVPAQPGYFVNMYQLTTAGTSGGTPPNWTSGTCNTNGSACNDGTAVWTKIGGTNYFSAYGCSGGDTFAQWQSLCGFDLHGGNSYYSANSNFTIPLSSPLIGAGTNLTSLGLSALDIGAPQTFGVSGSCGSGCIARPSTGAWDIGAYQYSAGADVYFAQSSAGSGTGLSCANAESLATFNAGSATAGNTYHACGTLTGAITTPACTSGSSGNKCELLFESGANITMAAIPATGGVNLNGNNYWIADGGNACGTLGSPQTLTTCASSLTGTGIIQSTNNGSAGTYANQVASVGVYFGGSTVHDVEVRNFIAKNLYIKNVNNDNSAGASDSYGVYGRAGSNVLIHDLAATFARGLIVLSMQGTGNNAQIYNNYLIHGTWGVFVDQGSNSGVQYTNLLMYGNYVNIGADWSDSDGNYHQDGLFVSGSSGTPKASFTGVYLYNNFLTFGAVPLPGSALRDGFSPTTPFRICTSSTMSSS